MENVKKMSENPEKREQSRMKTKMMKMFKDEGEDSLWKNNEYNGLQGIHCVSVLQNCLFVQYSKFY